MKLFLVAFAVTVCMNTTMFAQQTHTTQQSTPTLAAPQEQVILKPSLTVSDVAFTLDVLSRITINGNEVDAFLDVKKRFSEVFAFAQKEKKNDTDILSVDLPLATAQNFMNLYQRTQVPGSAAEKYQSIRNAIIASADKLKENEKNTSRR